MCNWLQELNPQQRAAAEFGEGPLLIIAGAGSGKTKTLAARVSSLVARGCDPGRIMLLTFTRRAAREMVHRAQATSDDPDIPRVWGGTFHSIGARLLRTYADTLGLNPEFTILDSTDAADLMDMVRREIGLTGFQGKRAPMKKTLLGIYSKILNTGLSLTQTLTRFYPDIPVEGDQLRGLFRRFAEYKQQRNVLDYDDLLLLWSKLLDHQPLQEHLDQLFVHVLVDEYQDTNHLQAEILRKMRINCHNITVVGDDAQSIYGFRGADIHNILDFPKQFPQTTILKLEINYRSQQPILDLANRIIGCADQQYTKVLRTTRKGDNRPLFVHAMDDQAEAQYVARSVLIRREEGIPLTRQAVLFRSAFQSAQLEVILAKYNIPFRKFGGLRFLESAHIKDILAILRIAENPKDPIAWMRILLLIPGIGPTSAARLLDQFNALGANPACLEQLQPPPKAKATFQQFTQLMAAITNPNPPPPHEQLEKAYRFYAPLMEAKYENARTRARDLEELGAIAQSAANRRQFLTDLALEPVSTGAFNPHTPPTEDEVLTLSTIHSAKGCEWDVVYLLHAAEGMIPSSMSMHDQDQLAEERRLLYVAITRARDSLSICFPAQYQSSPFRRGHRLNQRTSFLDRAAMALMDTVSAGDLLDGETAPVDAPTHLSPRIGKNAMQSMIDMWEDES